MSDFDHVLKHRLGLPGCLCLFQLIFVFILDRFKFPIMLTPLRQKLTNLFFDFLKRHSQPINFPLLESRLYLNIISLLLQNIQLIPCLLLLVISSTEQLPLNQVQMNLLVFKLPLLLHRSVPLQTF